ATPNSIQITVTGNPTPLVWKGGKQPGPNICDHNVTNWLNTGTRLYDRFYNGDLITFDDTGITNIINITETSAVGGMVMGNSSLSYAFTGAGNLTGEMTKEGSGLVTFALSNSLTMSFITNNNGTLAFNPPADQNL